MKTWKTTTFILGVGIMGAQAPPTATFDVASIRQASAPTADAVRSGQFRTGTIIGKDNAEFNFVTLAELLPYAYGVKQYQVAGPPLLKEARWNIQARFDESYSGQVPEMLRALLTERFKLGIHHENREQPVYELVVAKGGPKMEVIEAVAAPTAPPPSLPGLSGPLGGRGKGKGEPPPEGGRGKGQEFKGKGKGGFGGGGRGPFGALGDSVTMQPSPETCTVRLAFSKLSMANLADTLAPFLDRPVLDSTGLKGTYKAGMNLPMDAMRLVMENQRQNSGLESILGARGGPGGPGGGGPAGRGGGDGKGKGGPGGRGPGGCEEGGGALAAGGDTNSSNAIFQAVQQLGLRLQPKKALFDTIVVDRVEKQPTEN